MVLHGLGHCLGVITPSSSMGKAVSTVSSVLNSSSPDLTLLLGWIWKQFPALDLLPRLHCLVLEGTLHSRLQHVPLSYCSFLAQLLLPFPKQKQLLPAFHIALFTQSLSIFSGSLLLSHLWAVQTPGAKLHSPREVVTNPWPLCQGSSVLPTLGSSKRTQSLGKQRAQPTWGVPLLLRTEA